MTNLDIVSEGNLIHLVSQEADGWSKISLIPIAEVQPNMNLTFEGEPAEKWASLKNVTTEEQGKGRQKRWPLWTKINHKRVKRTCAAALRPAPPKASCECACEPRASSPETCPAWLFIAGGGRGGWETE